MADTATNSPAPAASPKKAKAAAASKKPRVKPAHPPTADMVNAAIKSLKERGGSSLQAIKKYIAANYKVDSEKLAPFIKKYLKAAVASGALVQPKGKGASGSFKLSGEGKTAAVKKAPVKQPKEKKAVAKTAPKKKTVAAKKPAAEKKKVAAAKPKTPSKAKKTAKPPTKKPKTPKPKKAAVKKQKSPKKAAPKKK